MRSIALIFTLFIALASHLAADPQFSVPSDCKQLVVVRNATWDTTTATMSRFERCCEKKEWKRVGTDIPVNLGRTGLAWGRSPLMSLAEGKEKQEGDGRSPAGIFPLLSAFGHPEPPQGYAKENLPFLAVSKEQCVDDRNSPHYNKVVEPKEVGGVTWNSAERMKIGVYELGLVVGHNCPKAVSGKGSCIFFHLQEGPGIPTSGCTSMTRPALTDLVLWLKKESSPHVVQVPEATYEKLGKGFPQISD